MLEWRSKGRQSKTRGKRPAFCVSSCGLPPVAFLHLPVVALVNPPVGNPTSAFMRWTLPAARRPDITATLPAVIAVNPHKAPLWRTAALFVHGGRRTDANYNLRERSRRSQGESQQQCHCNLLHGDSIPPWLDCFPEHSIRSRLLFVPTLFQSNSCEPVVFYTHESCTTPGFPWCVPNCSVLSRARAADFNRALSQAPHPPERSAAESKDLRFVLPRDGWESTNSHLPVLPLNAP